MNAKERYTTQESRILNRNTQSLTIGFIQAGGRSSRMNQDKAWLEIEDAPMIERVIAAVAPAVDRLGIIVSSDNARIDRYQNLADACGATLIFDLHGHLGPLGGIHTGLASCGANESALILACDTPFITTEFLSFIRDIHQNGILHSTQLVPHSVTVPVDHTNRLQPLSALYDKSIEADVEQMIAANELRVDWLYSRVPTLKLGYAEFAHLTGAERFFVNINTPEEYQALRG